MTESWNISGHRPSGDGIAPVALVDVHYLGDQSRAACVVVASWTDAAPVEERVALLPGARPYRPGAFFERELPCILRVLERVRTDVRTVVVDGYVDLDSAGAPGLGGHLHAALGGAAHVVGIAKTPFRGAAFAVPVTRGDSRRPLFVTSRGVPSAEAAGLVRSMYGKHRIPTIVTWVDQLARGLRAETSGVPGELEAENGGNRGGVYG